MDLKKFNQSVSDLIQKSNNEFGFVQPDKAEQLHNQMKEVAEKLKVCVDESINICLSQNLIATDNILFGQYLAEMSKLMWTYIISQPLQDVLTTEDSIDQLISTLHLDDMKLLLAQYEATNDSKVLSEVLPKYDSLSESVIKDAFKTMQLKKLKGE